ncbi:hypothetical protein RFI_20793 [Reticulomyxa filosa]|uniref:Uncharacterized protein n=1 Tax=Reticulomyxa filosa TaxID=46433 RepID=X6MS96_RETFI|nr:hypothetical protein RFI_20793 [Reticulomyxa filosa]|eukprot:ETO16546.1 hypothetical protein RFI_20793 [Reticulomyxa filosa]
MEWTMYDNPVDLFIKQKTWLCSRIILMALNFLQTMKDLKMLHKKHVKTCEILEFGKPTFTSLRKQWQRITNEQLCDIHNTSRQVSNWEKGQRNIYIYLFCFLCLKCFNCLLTQLVFDRFWNIARWKIPNSSNKHNNCLPNFLHPKNFWKKILELPKVRELNMAMVISEF